MTNRHRGVRFSQELAQDFFQPLFQRVQQRPASQIADLMPLFWETSTDIALDGIQSAPSLAIVGDYAQESKNLESRLVLYKFARLLMSALTPAVSPTELNLSPITG